MLKQIYSSVRKYLPKEIRSNLTKVVFIMPWKPLVKKDNIDLRKKFPGGEKGGLIISADFEMSWAFRFSKKTQDFISIGKHERVTFPKVLELFERYNIPITWATVGHLFLDSCQKGDHDWMARIPHFNDHWRFTEGDWFDHDPYSDYKTAGEWYAPDLIKQILASPVTHEIGCHTFSHIDCSYKNCPPEVLDDELKACREVASRYDLKLSSFVFPGGTAGNFEVLKNHGYRIYRKNIDIDLAYPFFDEWDMLVTPTTSSFGDNGLGWSADYFFYRYQKFIDKAIKTNTVAHFWFHPSIDKWSLQNVMPKVLNYASQKRDQGSLWIGTMKEISDHILNRSN